MPAHMWWGMAVGMWFMIGARAQTQNCSVYQDCQYSNCNNTVMYGCNCDWRVYNGIPFDFGCINMQVPHIVKNTCYQAVIDGIYLIYAQCPPKGSNNTIKFNTSTMPIPTTAVITTLAPATTSTTTAVPGTTSAYVPTTTKDPSLPPDPPSNIPGLVKVGVGVGEYCANLYTGFDSSSLRMPEALYLGEPVYSNVRGCNGTWFALLSVVTNRWYGFVCPWEMNKGCTVINNGGYYIVCDSGCSAKSQCVPAPANAYYIGAGSSVGNCPYNCQDNYEKLGNGSCVRVTVGNELPVPEQQIRRCYRYSDCDHCPRVGFSGSTIYSVWGCAGNDVRLSVFSTTSPWVRDTVLLAAYCVYYVNDTDVRYCPEPVVTTTPAPGSSQGVANLSVVNVSGNGTAPIVSNPRYRCKAYSNCSFCPGPFTSGCSGVSVVQRFSDGRYGVILKNFAPSGMMQRYCVYLTGGSWRYCPDDGMPISEIVLVKKAISFWFNVPEGLVNDVILQRYRWRISVVLGVDQELIELVPGISQMIRARRRLLADNLVYANMQVDADKADNITMLINSPAFFQLIFYGDIGNLTSSAVNAGTTGQMLVGTTTARGIAEADDGGSQAKLADVWVAVIVGVVMILIIGGVAVGIVVGCRNRPVYARIPKERVIAVRLRV